MQKSAYSRKQSSQILLILHQNACWGPYFNVKYWFFREPIKNFSRLPIFRFWPRNGPHWMKLARASPDRPTGIQNTSTHCAWVGHIHIMRFGPLTDLYGTPGAPKRARFGPKRPFLGPRRSSEGPRRTDLKMNAPDWPVFVGFMVTTHVDLKGDPKRASFGPESLLGPRRSSEGPRGQKMPQTP